MPGVFAVVSFVPTLFGEPLAFLCVFTTFRHYPKSFIYAMN